MSHFIDEYRGKRIWRLIDLHAQEVSCDRYTLNDIARWQDCTEYFRFAKGSFQLGIAAFNDNLRELFRIDWTPYFQDSVGKPTAFVFDEICEDLRHYVQRLKELAAENN